VEKSFPKHYEDLISLMGQFGTKIPSTVAGFDKLRKANRADGSFSSKTKVLFVYNALK
jgi:hypothetical protein